MAYKEWTKPGTKAKKWSDLKALKIPEDAWTNKGLPMDLGSFFGGGATPSLKEGAECRCKHHDQLGRVLVATPPEQHIDPLGLRPLYAQGPLRKYAIMQPVTLYPKEIISDPEVAQLLGQVTMAVKTYRILHETRQVWMAEKPGQCGECSRPVEFGFWMRFTLWRQEPADGPTATEVADLLLDPAKKHVLEKLVADFEQKLLKQAG